MGKKRGIARNRFKLEKRLLLGEVDDIIFVTIALKRVHLSNSSVIEHFLGHLLCSHCTQAFKKTHRTLRKSYKTVKIAKDLPSVSSTRKRVDFSRSGRKCPRTHRVHRNSLTLKKIGSKYALPSYPSFFCAVTSPNSVSL